MRRIAVIGASCSGKSTFARQMARVLRCPHVELDALHWGPNWTGRTTEELRRLVDEATSPSSWVTDGNYLKVRDIIWQRADTVIWLNYPLPLVFFRAVWRTLRRSLTREVLFGGNRESFIRSFLTRDSILLWVLSSYPKIRREYPKLLRRTEQQHLKVVELRSPQTAERFLGALVTE